MWKIYLILSKYLYLLNHSFCLENKSVLFVFCQNDFFDPFLIKDYWEEELITGKLLFGMTKLLQRKAVLIYAFITMTPYFIIPLNEKFHLFNTFLRLVLWQFHTCILIIFTLGRSSSICYSVSNGPPWKHTQVDHIDWACYILQCICINICIYVFNNT